MQWGMARQRYGGHGIVLVRVSVSSKLEHSSPPWELDSHGYILKDEFIGWGYFVIYLYAYTFVQF